ncbi:MAG: glycosyltransferase family 1 protein [Patescibacteria group bacterium]|nr:glycosyltransferase family 1 protein [Patescibacteria group bacterium]
MRISIDIRPMLEANRSGVSGYSAHIVNALACRAKPAGWDYALFCNAWNRPLPPDLPSADWAERRFHHWPNRLLNASFMMLGRPRVEELTGGADLVYLPNINFIATAAPLVVTAHDLSFERFPEFFSAKQRLWHAAIRPRQLFRRAAAVITVSEHTKTDVMELYGVPAEKIHVVPPAPVGDFSRIDAAAISSVRERYSLPDKFFLYLGTIEPRKNLIGLIEAFEKLPRRENLVIAGGRGWLYHDVFRRIAASPARDRIRFLDYFHEADKPALLAAATVFVFPSFYEGFGMPPLEAMAAGTPVVASRVSSLGEVVRDASLLVNPHDIAEIAAAMQAASEDNVLRADLITRGRARAAEFSWDKSAEALENVFAKIAI